MCRNIFSNLIFVSGCVEDTSWKTIKGGNYNCADYATKKWCENGAIGKEWDVTWDWLPGTNGLPATSVCCVCGGKGVTSGSYGKSTFEEKIDL